MRAEVMGLRLGLTADGSPEDFFSETCRSRLRRVGGDFVDLDGLLPFGGDGVALFHRHGGILQEHLRTAAAAPGEEVQEMVLAQGLGPGRRVGVGLAVWCAAVDVMHGMPRVVSLSMPDGASQFQPAGFDLMR